VFFRGLPPIWGTFWPFGAFGALAEITARHWSTCIKSATKTNTSKASKGSKPVCSTGPRQARVLQNAICSQAPSRNGATRFYLGREGPWSQNPRIPKTSKASKCAQSCPICLQKDILGAVTAQMATGGDFKSKVTLLRSHFGAFWRLLGPWNCTKWRKRPFQTLRGPLKPNHYGTTP